MKQVAEHIFARGKRGILYVRRRIPTSLRAAYPVCQTHLTCSLKTSDLSQAKALARVELTRMDAEFSARRDSIDLSRASCAAKRVRTLSDAQLKAFAQFWLRSVLSTDQTRREDGLDDEEFDDLGARLTAQRAEFGRMLAQGRTMEMFSALHGFLFLCGVDYQPDSEEAKRASSAFLRVVVECLDKQLARQRGEPVDTDVVAPDQGHPLQVVAPDRARPTAERPTWDAVFAAWRDYVTNRPASTTTSARTPWNDLRRFAELHGVTTPVDVVPRLLTDWVESMRERGLAAKTINERVVKVRSVFRVAAGRHVVPENPAVNTLGVRESTAEKRRKRRFPFALSDLQTFFGSAVFTKHERSIGQLGEATFWVPVIMFFTGARPEEVAGLALDDVVEVPGAGWAIRFVDHYGDGADAVPETHRRTLKNAPSRRMVPVAQKLIDLGLLRYVESLRKQGETMMFPSLRHDCQGKLFGAGIKFFARYIRAVGVSDSRVVLYSLRHTAKDLFEAAAMPSKYLKRLMGHASGDGAVTDGYGSDVPFDILAREFAKVRFPELPVLPWQSGVGRVSVPGLAKAGRNRRNVP